MHLLFKTVVFMLLLVGASILPLYLIIFFYFITALYVDTWSIIFVSAIIDAYFGRTSMDALPILTLMSPFVTACAYLLKPTLSFYTK